MGQTWIQILIGISIFVNFICMVLLFLRKEEDSNMDEIKADIMLLNRNFFNLKKEIEILTEELHAVHEFVQQSGENSHDEIGKYLKIGMSHQDIAKTMNKSVKEIDLMVKLRGSR